MAKFGNKSKEILATVHQDLQTVLEYAIKIVDFTILRGACTAEEQFQLYKQGRKKVGDAWVIANKKKVVTYKDGHIMKSRHQYKEAIDIAFYRKTIPHIIWDDDKANYYLVGIVLGVAEMLRQYGAIDCTIRSGANWDCDEELDDETFYDVFHIERNLP